MNFSYYRATLTKKGAQPTLQRQKIRCTNTKRTAGSGGRTKVPNRARALNRYITEFIFIQIRGLVLARSVLDRGRFIKIQHIGRMGRGGGFKKFIFTKICFDTVGICNEDLSEFYEKYVIRADIETRYFKSCQNQCTQSV